MRQDDEPTDGGPRLGLAVLAGTALATLMLAGLTDVFAVFVRWVDAQATPELEEHFVAMMITAIVAFIVLLRKERALRHSLTAQARAEARLQEREERYRSLLAHLPVGTYRTTPDGTIVAANPAAAHLFGFDDEETLLQHNARDLYVDGAERDEQMVETVNEQLRTSTVHLRHRDGRLLLVRDYVRPVCDDEGTLRYFDGVLIDITSQKRVERALRESEARYRQLVEQSPLPLVVHDGTVILFANAACAELVGAPGPDAILGTPVMDYVAEAHRTTAAVRIRAIFAGSVPVLPISIQLRQLDGTLLDVELHSAPTTYGGRIASQVIIQDVTDQKRYEHQLRIARDEAEEMSRLKSAFLANMSHEIRTPLTGIIGFARVLEEEVTSDEHREVAALVHESGTRLLETLNSVLDYARLEAGAVELDTHRLDLVHEVCEAAALYRPLAERDGLTFDLDVPAGEIYAQVDPAHLRRVLTNLFSNAVKFTDQGGVTVRLEARDGEARLHVSDTGSGIDKAFLPFLFQEFRQESSGLARQYPGSGLGLAISRRLVEHMGGRIDVQTSKGEGSTFTIAVPLAQPPSD